MTPEPARCSLPDPCAADDGPLLLEPRSVYDAAFLGWGRRPGDPTAIAVYSYTRIIKSFMQHANCDWDEAEAFTSYNTEGAWLGRGTPLIIHEGTPAELEELL